MKLNYILCLSGFLSLGILSAQAQDYTGMKIQRYRHWAKGQISLVPLEIGQITPEGWLRQWGEDAAKGITGHLDEYQPVYGNGWKGFGFKARGANETDGTGWPIEQCSYWLDGATKLAYILGDRALQKKVSDRLNIVVDGVHKGAGTFIWWKNDSLVLDGFNNWGHGIMGRALVSYYQATHQPRILEALNKVYSRYTMLSPTNQKGLESGLVRGSTNVDAMTETFLENGNKTILDSIIAYSDRPLVRQFGQRIMQMSDRSHEGFKTAHGVTFYEVSRVPAISSIWNGREEDRDVSLHLLSWAGKYNMLPFGLVSCEEYLSGTGLFMALRRVTSLPRCGTTRGRCVSTEKGNGATGSRTYSSMRGLSLSHATGRPCLIIRCLTASRKSYRPIRLYPGRETSNIRPTDMKCCVAWAAATGKFPTMSRICGWRPWITVLPTHSTAPAR